MLHFCEVDKFFGTKSFLTNENKLFRILKDRLSLFSLEHLLLLSHPLFDFGAFFLQLLTISNVRRAFPMVLSM
jgi:hypothetical protein